MSKVLQTNNSLHRNTVYSNVLRVVNNKKFKIAMEVAKIAGSTFSMYAEKRSNWGLISGMGSCALKLIEELNVYPWDYFDNWDVVLNKEFSSLIVSILVDFPYEEITPSSESVTAAVRLYDLKGHKVGYIANKKMTDSRVKAVYAMPEEIVEVEEILRELIWKKFDCQNIVIRKNKVVVSGDRNNDIITFDNDETFKPLDSQLANEKADLYKRFNDAGISRALLFYGPPGTGKSTLARAIVDKLGYKTLRVKLNDLSGLDGTTLLDSISLVQPDALILDDLDRSHNKDDLLETFEALHNSHLKLVIASANNTSRFDGALLRPGRFDDIVLVERLDDVVIKNVLGEENLDLFETVKDWPIVFVEDVRRRLQVMSKEEATESIKELTDRVESIKNYVVNDEWSLQSTPVTKNKFWEDDNDDDDMQYGEGGNRLY